MLNTIIPCVCVLMRFPPSPQVKQSYTGPLDDELGDAMLSCDPEGPLMIHVTKLYPNQDATVFHAFGRVISGTCTYV